MIKKKNFFWNLINYLIPIYIVNYKIVIYTLNFQTYLDWEHKRISVLEAQMKEIDRERRINNIKKIKEDLEKREQFLTFFDKEEEIELKIEKIQEKIRKEDERIHAMHNSAKHLRNLITTESYIPPEVKNKK